MRKLFASLFLLTACACFGQAVFHSPSSLAGFTQVGGGSSKTPDQVSGLYAWYKPEAVNFGGEGAVSSWTNAPGMVSYTISPSYGSPTNIANGVNGYNYVAFDGSDDNLTSANSTKSQPYAMVAVLRMHGVGSPFTFNNSSSSYVRSFSAGALSVGDGTSWIGLGTDGFPTNEWAVLSVTLNGTNSSIQRNLGTPVTGNAGTNSLRTIMMGRYGGSYACKVNIAEAAYWTNAVSTDDISAVVTGLMTKYGL